MRLLQPIGRSMLRSLALVLLAAATTPAASPRDALFVSTAWLAQHLADPTVVVLYVGDKAEYTAKHIPGARHVALSNLSVDTPELQLEMLPAEELRQRLAALGVSNSSRIVVCYGSLTAATRVMFTLDYAGLGNASSLLDGGMDAWTREGRPVTSDVTPAGAGTLALTPLTPLTPRPIVVDAAFVLAHVKTPHFAVVDGRAAAFYDGVQTGGPKDHPHRPGHIAGAYSVPYASVVDEQLKFRTAEDLNAIFTSAGVRPDDTIIGYCHIGQQATAMLFAARSLGHPVLLYDGSFEDWSRHADYPVDNPAKKGGGR